jgi:uncharacterized membrane protein
MTRSSGDRRMSSSSTRGSRWALPYTLAALCVFFGLVAYILGPIVFKPHDERAAWYFMHITGGVLVLACGPFQFIATVRNRFRRYHRAAGYTYVVATLMAVAGYIGLPKSGLFLLSQTVALSLWILAVVFAVWSIRRGNVLSHQHNMARSFVLAAYFLTARLFDKHGMWLLVPFSDSVDVRLVHSDWLAWVIPLVLVEIYFSRKWQLRPGGGKQRA